MPAVETIDRGEPPDGHALVEGLLQLLLVRRHDVAGPPVDDHGVGGAEAPRRAGGVHRRVAPAVDGDAAAELDLALLVGRAQETERVEDPAGVARRDVGALGQLGTDAEEDRVEAALAPLLVEIADRVSELQLDPDAHDPADLGVEDVAGQAVGGDAVAHHAPRLLVGVGHDDVVAESGELVGAGEAGGAGADDEHATSRRDGRGGELPAPLQRNVAEEALDGVDPDRLVELAAVAGRLARVVADPPHGRRERVVLDEAAPRPLVVAGLGVVQPGLAVLPCRAGIVAWRHQVDVHRSLDPPRSRAVGTARAGVERDREGALHQLGPPVVPATLSSRP